MISAETHINIISFDVPFPPDYGGVIDVFYKIKALFDAGIKVHLHCFEYGRGKAPELNTICEEVIYYKRDKMWKGFLSDKPFIVQTRNSKELKNNLLKNNFPVLFEGLHCCYFLADEFLRNRLRMVRMHNDEAKYYLDLANRETGFGKKVYYFAEYRRLIKYERVLEFADTIFCISPKEASQYQNKFRGVKYLAPFHGNIKISSLTGKGTYILYHGNLGVSENNEAALFLLKHIFNSLQIPFIIAGNNPSEQLKKVCSGLHHVKIIENPDSAQMDKLISEAQINLLPTFQNTGIKLKLLNALFNGRFCIVNSIMADYTGLEKYCLSADEPQKMIELITQTMELNFTAEMISKRYELIKEFSDTEEVKKIITLLQLPLPE